MNNWKKVLTHEELYANKKARRIYSLVRKDGMSIQGIPYAGAPEKSAMLFLDCGDGNLRGLVLDDIEYMVEVNPENGTPSR